MKYISLVSRILLGLVFVVFGLNHIHNFIKMPMPTGLAGQYLYVLFASRILYVVSALEVIGGLLLLFNRFVALGLVLLGPIIVNIFLYNAILAPSGLGIAAVIVLLYMVVIRHHKAAFEPLLRKDS